MDIPQPWVLSTDLTEWSFGQKRFNILMLGVIHNGIAYPVVWEMLEKKGNSHSDERMDLLDRFYSIFPDAKVAYLTGDREFIGKAWLSYLLIKPTIPFRLRIRESDRIDHGRKQLRATCGELCAFVSFLLTFYQGKLKFCQAKSLFGVV